MTRKNKCGECGRLTTNRWLCQSCETKSHTCKRCHYNISNKLPSRTPKKRAQMSRAELYTCPPDAVDRWGRDCDDRIALNRQKAAAYREMEKRRHARWDRQSAARREKEKRREKRENIRWDRQHAAERAAVAKKELARFYTAPVKRFESARGAAPSATVIPTLRLRQEPPSRRRPDDDVEIVSSIEPGDALEQPYSDASVYRIPNPALDQKTLERLRPVFAAVAQRVYDAWEQDDDGEDPDYGVGGICDAIADAMCEVIDAHGGEAITVNSEGMGENHTWAVARCADGVFLVDIPPSVYETGGGYSWEKIPDVLFEADDVVIDELPEDAWDELADGY